MCSSIPMSNPAEAIRGRWRRLRDGVQAVRDAVGGAADGDAVPDAVARALDALYDLMEVVKQRGDYTNEDLDNLAAGDVGGETTFALVCARGAKTHALVDFGDLHTFGSHAFGEGPYGGGWAWQEFSDPKFCLRSDWYARRVQGHLVLGPLEVAVAWLLQRPEISLP